MKKNKLYILMLVLLLVTSCNLFSSLGFRALEGSGRIITEKRNVSGFVRVDVCCGMELYLSQSSHESLEIEADDNLLPEIETRVVSGKLEINYKESTNANYHPSQPVRLYLSAVDLQEASISGGGMLSSESFETNRLELNLSGGSESSLGDLEVDDFKIKISGGGELKAETLEVNSLQIDLSGGSDIEIDDLAGESFSLDASGGGKAVINGIVYDSNIDLGGGSSIDGQNLEIQEVFFSCSGGGSSTIWVDENLDVNLSGGCSLRYFGQPEIVNQDLSGGSNIRSLGDR